MKNDHYITFTLGGMVFEYDNEKNTTNIEVHGISFRTAARVFFDYDRIDYYDEENSSEEERYDTIGDLSAGGAMLVSRGITSIGSIGHDDVVYVVYTERTGKNKNGDEIEIIRLISARYATSFERGLYYGKY